MFFSLFYNAFKENQVVALMLEGMQAGVGAVICAVVIEMATGILKEKNPLYAIIMVIAFIANYFFNVSVILIIICCILFGLFYTLYKERRLLQ